MEAESNLSNREGVKKRVLASEGRISGNIYRVTARPPLRQQYKLILNGQNDVKYRLCEFNCVECFYCPCVTSDSGYPHDGRADKNAYPHDRRADKDSYLHDSNNQSIILRLQLSFAMINVQLMLV